MSSDVIFYFFIALMLVFMFLSSRKRKKGYQDLMASLQVGSEIMLTSGIFGKIVSIEGDHLTVEIAAKTNIKVLRGAIAKVVPVADAAEPAVAAAAATPVAKATAKAAATKAKSTTKK